MTFESFGFLLNQLGQARQLVRIAKDINLTDLLINNVHGKHHLYTTIKIADKTWLPVDLQDSPDRIFGSEFITGAHQQAGYLVRSKNRIHQCPRLTSAVG